MSLFDLDPTKRWLFAMTHPDDEVFIGAWITRLVENGNEVWMSWTHSTKVREMESRKVASMLGVPQSQLKFFGGPDGSICDEMPTLVHAFDGFITEVIPDVVVCAAFEQGHIDHDATNFMVNHTFSGPILEVPLYHTYATRLQQMNVFSDPVEQEILTLTPVERKLKMKLAQQYPSQNILAVLAAYEAYQALQFKPVELAKREILRRQTHQQWDKPNHSEAIAAQIEKCPTWRRWLAAVSRVDLRSKVAIGR